MKYTTAEGYYKSSQIQKLASTDCGTRFLKLKSLRIPQVRSLATKHSIDIQGGNPLKIVYESSIQIASIDEFISELYEQERAERRGHEDKLVSELYKIQSFGWGGIYQNDLKKTIVNQYVKKIDSYDLLNNAIENDIHTSMRAYVLASWYNHWSSIIIEDIFNDHQKVTPAIGRIEKIDFFIGSKPFDLKVTYLPEGYIKDCRKSKGLDPELKLMKRACEELGIEFNNVSDSTLIPDLWRKLDDHPHQSASELISELQECRENILNEAISNPESLVRWLYENQGSNRFDTSNRLFLVLIDLGNFFDSWKLKRAKPLISENVNTYLDSVSDEVGFQLDFNWEGITHTVESAVIFVVKQ